MHALLNKEELVVPLAKRMLTKHLQKTMTLSWPALEQYLIKEQKKFSKSLLLTVDFNTVNQLITSDLTQARHAINAAYKNKYRPLINWLAQNLKNFDLDLDVLLALNLNSNHPSFIKNLANQIDPDIQLSIDPSQIPPHAPVVFRNIIKNEKMIKRLIKDRTPFWFVDTGYTNFVTGKKTWHRLVQNNLHHSPVSTTFPADRLNLLGSFPRTWRSSGSCILVVESTDRYMNIFDNSIEAWRSKVGKDLREHTDLYIEFRSKNENKKNRDSLYERLQKDKDIYCVVTESSAAAIEAIWCGIPVITLGRHITNSVSRNSLSDINDLYRGDLGNWLCALSYSQFTEQEMLDGTAWRLTKEYYHV